MTLSWSTWTALKVDSNQMFTTAAVSDLLEIRFKATQWPLYFNVWTYGLGIERTGKEGQDKKKKKKLGQGSNF